MVALLLSTNTSTARGTGESVPTIHIEELTSTPLHEPTLFWVESRKPDVTHLPLEQFQPLTDTQVNRGITGEAYWIRVRLSNKKGDQTNAGCFIMKPVIWMR